MYLGAHTLTIGASLERFEFDNSFNLAAYDPFGFIGGTFGPGFESVNAFSNMSILEIWMQLLMEQEQLQKRIFGH